MESYLYRIPPEQGPRVTVIGGGTGLSTLLRGLKLYTKNLTAVVTVADDGGGSGVLRHDLGMLPPGDVRSCLEALANTEPLMQRLMHYRFTEGTLAGQSCGNLFLAALSEILPSFDQAVESLSQILAITGRVLPVTNESSICGCKRRHGCRIRRVRLRPAGAQALPAVLEAIREADMVILGPGSLYTSIIPNLLVGGVVEAIMDSGALKVYVCNVMTQAGETEGYTAADHIRALFDHAWPGLFDICLTSDSPIPRSIAERYLAEGAEPLLCDREACEALGVEVISRPVVSVENDLVRHNPGHLARELMALHAERNMRLVEPSTPGHTRNKVER